MLRMSAPQPSNTRPLILGTLSFAVSFAAWGLISAFAPRFREMFSLTATQTALLVAVPVLLGSLLRLPMGMLADRFGGRAVFTVLLLAVAAPAWLVPAAASSEPAQAPTPQPTRRGGSRCDINAPSCCAWLRNPPTPAP